MTFLMTSILTCISSYPTPFICNPVSKRSYKSLLFLYASIVLLLTTVSPSTSNKFSSISNIFQRRDISQISNQLCFCLCVPLFLHTTRRRPFLFTNLQDGHFSFNAVRILYVRIDNNV